MRLFVFFGGLIVLALLAALIAPPFIDWNQFRDRFEKEASRVVGQDVRVLGQTSARLLPLPSITFEKVRVGDEKQPMLAADSFHINMELAPLLKGDVVIVDMALAAPKLDLRINDDGKLDWTARQVELPADFKASDVSLNKFTITNGVVRLRDRRDRRELILNDIDFSGAARSLAGPWRGEGSVSRADQRFGVSASTGSWQAAESANGFGQLKVKLGVQPQYLPYDVEFDGPVSLKNGVPQFAGSFLVRPMGKQSDSDRIAFDRSSAGESVDGTLDGVVKIGVRGAVVPDYKLRIGDKDDPYVLSGTAFANFNNEESFEINADGQQINFAQLNAGDGVDAESPQSVQDRLAALQELLLRVPRFSAPGRINLTLPAIVAGDTVVRDIAVEASPLKGGKGWAIKSLEAELPGRTDLLASGDLGLVDELTYEGSLVLASRQPSGFAAWLAKDVPAPIRALRNAGFSGNVSLQSGNLSADNVEFVLDGKELKGALQRRPAPQDATGGPATIKAQLRGEEINLDALSALVDLAAGEDAVARHKVEFDLEAGRVLAFGQAADDIVAKGAVGSEVLNLSSLTIGSFKGSAVDVSGRLQRSDGVLKGDLQGKFVAADPAPALAFFNGKFGAFGLLDHLIENPSLTAATDITFNLSGAEDQSAVTLLGQSGGSAIDLEVLFDGSGPWQKRSANLVATLSNPRSDRVLEQLGFNVIPLDTGKAGTITVSAKGNLSKPLETLTSFEIAGLVGALRGDLEPVFSRDGVELSGDLDVDVRSRDLDDLISITGLPLPGFGEGQSGQVQMALTVKRDNLASEKLVLRLGETELRGSLALSRVPNARPRLIGKLVADRLESAFLAHLAFGQNGDDAGSSNISPSRLLSGFDGEIDVAAKSLILPVRGLDVKSVSSTMSINDGDVSFSGVSAKVLQGDLTGRVSLARAGAARLARGDLSFSRIDVADLLSASGYGAGIEGQADATLTFDASAGNGSSFLDNLAGGGSMQLSGLEVAGFDDQGFANLLARIDEEQSKSTKPLEGSALNTLTSDIFQGATKVEAVTIPFAVASGVLRASDVLFGNDDVQGQFDIRLPLSTRETEFSARVKYEAGREAIVGVEPEVLLSLKGSPGQLVRSNNTDLLDTYLGQRTSEKRERAFLSQQAAILERQRLGREAQAIILARQAVERRERLKREKIKQEADEEARLNRSGDGNAVPDDTADLSPALNDLREKVLDSIAPQPAVTAD